MGVKTHYNDVQSAAMLKTPHVAPVLRTPLQKFANVSKHRLLTRAALIGAGTLYQAIGYALSSRGTVITVAEHNSSRTRRAV
jgi:hypothetical protein